jgi:hypothetical protein
MSEAPYQLKMMAAIGNVCLQYSRLEIMLSAIIMTLLGLDEHKAAIVTGGMDLKARIAVALNLLEEMNSPGSFRSSLRNIQSTLRKNELVERRNQAVHGAHKEENGRYTLTMLRYSKAKREQEITPYELADLGRQLCDLGNVAFALLGDIERWYVRTHRRVNGAGDLAVGSSIPQLTIAERLHARIKHLWRNLFG